MPSKDNIGNSLVSRVVTINPKTVRKAVSLMSAAEDPNLGQAYQVTLKAYRGNSGDIFVGGPGGQAHQLDATDEVTIWISRLSQVYVMGDTVGDRVSVLVVSFSCD